MIINDRIKKNFLVEVLLSLPIYRHSDSAKCEGEKREKPRRFPMGKASVDELMVKMLSVGRKGIFTF